MNFPYDQACDQAICDVAAGEQGALSVIYQAYGKMIYLVALQILPRPQDAEDVLQDVMLKLLHQAHNYRRGTNPRAWIMTITRTCAIDRYKKSLRAHPLEEAAELPSPQAEADEEALHLREALRTLEPDDRLLVQLRIYVGLSHAEIARVMKLREATVRKRYQRALEKLRAHYDEEGGTRS